MKSFTVKIRPAIFGIIIICFFLPFLVVSCQGQKIVEITGFQLVTGSEIKQPDMSDKLKSIGLSQEKKEEKIKPEPFAILAFIFAFIGLGISFLKGQKSFIASFITGLAGAISLLLLKAKLDNEILKQGEGILQLEYTKGFWLTFLLFLLAAGWNIFLFFQSKKQNHNAEFM